MPRGGHHGLWKPTPADIYRSRWKRFYKRSHRFRTPGNNPDRAGPHEQPRWHPDVVPSPWRIQYSLRGFEPSMPPDARPYFDRAYTDNLKRFLRPATSCNFDNRSGRDLILRCLDPGRRGGAHSGYGRPEVGNATMVPDYLENLIKDEAEKTKSEHFLEKLLMTPEKQSEVQQPQVFYVRRLAELLEEKEIVWAKGQTDPKANLGRSKIRQDLIGGTPGEEVNRGQFPYVDEQASLIDSLELREILRLRHRTNKRRHPKWLEITYQYKKWHKQYLRRRAMLQDEVKARMGVLRQAVAQS